MYENDVAFIRYMLAIQEIRDRQKQTCIRLSWGSLVLSVSYQDFRQCKQLTHIMVAN